MNCHPLLQPAAPWLYRSAETKAALESVVASERSGVNLLLQYLDGRQMTTVKGVLSEFGRRLEFPDYYGQNSAALFDCLQDLGWLQAESFLLVITNAESLLSDEPDEVIWLLFDLLERVCQRWAEPIALGQSWDRPAVPFHVIFHLAEKCDGTVPAPLICLPELGS